MEEERIALFLDYENLAIGAREHLRGAVFDFGPIADAIADRGRIVVKRAYADWTMFDDGRHMLARQNVELIEIPQKRGTVRKNAADIKLAVDAIELAFERDYITTYVLCTGDSDFTPLVAKLRELNKRVIGIGVAGSTSALLPPSVDEFLFYDRLEGIEAGPGRKRATPAKSARPRGRGAKAVAAPAEIEPEADTSAGDDRAVVTAPDTADLQTLVTRTLTGLERSGTEGARASSLKRAILRRDPTFNEADYGFRAFGELLRSLEASGAVALRPGGAAGDPEVTLPDRVGGEDEAFALLADVVAQLQKRSGRPHLSGLKDRMRKREPEFTEKRFGYATFLQFAKAAQSRGIIAMDWDDADEDYLVRTSDAAAE
ncbi:MAG TPA: NYN domain-containing protein [Acidimicrobiia bacterium]